MCIIIDTCAISIVFNPANKEHSDFKPVLDWLVTGNGKIVLGGKTYTKELFRLKKYFAILAELSKINKTISLDNKAVDQCEAEILKKKKHRTFDDAHLVAMVNESGCRIVCTRDDKANPHLKDKSLYVNGRKKPSLYTSKRNNNLLTDQYIPKPHKGHCSLNKKCQELITVALDNLKH